jgi:probable rRNA maturation factor
VSARPSYSVYLHVDETLTEEITPSEATALTAAATHALRVGGASAPASMTLVITTDEHVRRLNAEYLGSDQPTDVLSFPAEDQPYAVEPGEPPYLGDVLIAYQVAVAQGQEAGHGTLTEMQTLTVHGALHLLGYDHASSDEQAQMSALERAALDALSADLA